MAGRSYQRVVKVYLGGAFLVRGRREGRYQWFYRQVKKGMWQMSCVMAYDHCS